MTDDRTQGFGVRAKVPGRMKSSHDESSRFKVADRADFFLCEVFDMLAEAIVGPRKDGAKGPSRQACFLIFREAG
jgi:hypothetical protein